MKVEIGIQGIEKLRNATEVLFQMSDSLEGPYLTETARAIADHIAARAVENAPEDEGDLRDNIFAGEPHLKNGTAYADVRISDAIPYASLMHQHLLPFGISVGVSELTGRPIYSLGPISEALPSALEGGVGGMFIVRVAEYHYEQHESQMGRVLTSILTDQRMRTYRFSY